MIVLTFYSILMMFLRLLLQRFLLVGLIALFVSCGGTQKKSNSSFQEPENPERSLPSPNASRITWPERDRIFRMGETIELSVSSDRSPEQIDSVLLFSDGSSILKSSGLSSLVWDKSGSRVGKIPLSLRVFYADGSADFLQHSVILHSDIIPEQYSFEVINSYPHDVHAYTQGLLYDGGYLYESTGQYGESSIRKVRIETGEIIQSLSLDRELFGEGLCLFDDKLYQITWKNRVGFVYDKESLRVLNKIYYQTEGWGLTTDGKKLMMSNGSHQMLFLDPVYFSEIGRIEVYDHEGPVANLNELEMIDGMVYANVFMTDRIVVFSPKDGRVHAYVDLTGILPERYHHRRLDVLNGIAWDAEHRRLFVTGKYWPRLFEIRLKPN
jgi:glutaminyl-peptide cyclotransferase